MSKGYVLNKNNEPIHQNNTYFKEDLESMTLYKLKEICKKEKIIPGVIKILDKDELIQTILRYRGAYRGSLIKNYNVDSVERIKKIFKNIKEEPYPTELFLDCNYKITVYETLAIDFYDEFTIKYDPELLNTNAFIVDNKKNICAIFNVTTRGNNFDKLYLVKDKAIKCNESDIKDYKMLFVPKRTSEYIYNVYNNIKNNISTTLKVYYVNILDFTVKKPIKLSSTLSIDFGSMNTTMGTFIDEDYVESVGETRLRKNDINYVQFYDITQNFKQVPIFPSVIAIKSLDDPENPEYLFGHDAVKFSNSSYTDESFCVFYDIKKWILDYNKLEEVFDKDGRRAFIARKDMLKKYFVYLLELARNYFKAEIYSLHISSPVKQRYLFNKFFTETFGKNFFDLENNLDEGVCVLYSIISEMIRQSQYQEMKEYKALVIDCGGGSIDISSCTFKIEDTRVSYKIDVETSYENGDTDFGGNNLTYRIMQMLKISMANKLDKNIAMTFNQILNSLDSDVFRFIDKNGASEFYKILDEEYEKVESLIPTKFKMYENINKLEYSKVKHNFYYLFSLAEQIKQEFYNRVGVLKVIVTSKELKDYKNIIDETTEIVQAEKWKISVKTDKGLEPLKEIPEMVFNIFEIQDILKADIYNIIRKLINNTSQNRDLREYSIIKLTGQSCKIDIFRDALKEFIQGRLIRFRRVDRDLSDNYDLKLSCIDGSIKYLKDKMHGFAKIAIKTSVPTLPYQVTGYTHNGEEVVLIKAFDREGEIGMISRNMTDLTLNLYLKDVQNENKHSFIVRFKQNEFAPLSSHEVLSRYDGKISQGHTDDIVDNEVRVFVWSKPADIGFVVLPIYRQGQDLYIGKEMFLNFEDETWRNSFFDGSK